ncbi:DNA-binding transcriptional regulator, GntR family [Roseovarius azorensis]|uniref:DNA-binding transcriptional regulator, GntR family n=1 Tax=Roseovarius azorensis TaxID=1287727 RepID=A0A1H7RJS5_9RHOB|nr:GntR family transcriptional regulator [Roseovarius azorensis]SEL60540.1 DNA-binding transcriptional regulator, GntR family [Roseovarius azorensis]
MTAPDLLTERAYQALLSRLRDGRLASGAFLSMPVLVEQLGLPIAAVRDAVKRAEAGGLLSVLPKRGIMIMDAGPETTRDCLELRAMFDCEGTRLLIERGGEIPIAALRQEHERLRDEAQAKLTADLSRRAVRTDLSLHDALATGLGSGLARRLYAENRDRIAVIQNTRPFVPDRIVPAMNEHLAIIAAIEARDTNRAFAEIRNHLRNTLRWWGVLV